MSFNSYSVTIGSFNIYYYGLIITFGVLMAALIAHLRVKRFSLPSDFALDLILTLMPAGVIGARLYYVILKPENFKTFASIIDIHSGGLAIYGGIICGFLSAVILAKIKHIPLLKIADLTFPCVALAQSIGRWGNFVNREAYGILISNPKLQFFPLAVYIESENNWFSATFFYESLACLIIALYTLLSEKKHNYPGRNTILYLAFYACERCIVEGLRSDSLYLGSIRASQLLSAIIAAGVFVYMACKNKKPALLWAGISAVIVLTIGICLGSFTLISLGSVLMLCVNLMFVRCSRIHRGTNNSEGSYQADTKAQN